MDLQERLAQCQVDKKAIEVKEQELLTAIKEEEQKTQIPFARFVPNVKFAPGESRLILHLTPNFVRLAEQYKGCVVALSSQRGMNGVSVCCNSTKGGKISANTLVCQYGSGVQVLID